jgi:hypothetical protein
VSSRKPIALVALALAASAAVAQAPIVDESAAIATAANDFMAGGKPMFITANQLKDLMAHPASAPTLVSVCAPDDFAKAHVPGSINIPRGAFWKLPKDKLIVTYCYTGTGAVGPATVPNPSSATTPSRWSGA